VAEPVRLLGEAERWLATVDRAWFEGLDGEGLNALRVLGGPLGPAALRSFERRPYSADATRLVRWIDAERRGLERPLGASRSLGWDELIERLATSDERLSA
jgi:predicted HD phosphohydrolase